MEHVIKLLIVDDEKRFLEAIATRLRKRGFDVRAISNGPEAIQVLGPVDQVLYGSPFNGPSEIHQEIPEHNSAELHEARMLFPYPVPEKFLAYDFQAGFPFIDLQDACFVL